MTDLVPARREISRRSFMKLGAAAGIVAGLPFEVDDLAYALAGDPRIGPTPDLTFTMVRREDMVNLVVRGYNLQLSTSPSRLVRINTAQAAYLTFEFPSQHLLEAAIADPPGTTVAPPVASRLAGPSRIAFRLPTTLTGIGYRMSALLDWRGLGLIMLVPASATPPSTPALPGPLETSLEAPWGLFMTPLSDAAATWVHATTPVNRNGRVELWHTRLAQRSGADAIETPIGTPQLRAVFATSGDPVGLTVPLRGVDRLDLVSNMTGTAGAAPTNVEHYALSALGVTMNVSGSWDVVPAPTSLIFWRNRTAVGRDSFVRVVRKGFLHPFGHPAALISDTKREFRAAPNGDITAYLVRREYIVVRRAEVSYPRPFESASVMRAWPFLRVRLDKTVSPLLDQTPGREAVSPFAVDEAFWPTSSGIDVRWPVTAFDHEGRPVTFSAPLIFVYSSRPGTGTPGTPVAYDATRTALLNGAYVSSGGRRAIALGGQKVAMAPSGKPSDTTITVDTLYLAAAAQNAGTVALRNADEPSWAPTIESSDFQLTAAAALQGGPLGAATTMGWNPSYLTNGFAGNNVGQMFGNIISAPPTPNVPLDRAGGISSPTFPITGLSRVLGPVGGDVTKFTQPLPKFDPASVFSGLERKILGAFSLLDVLELVGLSIPSDPLASNDSTKMPKITTELVYPGNDNTKLPDGARTKLEWHPEVKDIKDFVTFNGDKKKSLDLIANLSTPLNKPDFPNTYDVLGELRTFTVTLLPGFAFIKLTFSKVRFTSKTGAKPSVDVGLDKIEFIGPLTFVNQLKDYLQTSGKGPAIDVQPSGVNVSYTLGLPTIAVGVFSLQNVALSVGLTLPFDSSPAHVDFAICSRDRPFLLTMGLFGGGGFFGLSLTLDGLRQIEVSIEFGANAQIDLGVASGGVHIMAGIYFRLTSKPADGTTPAHNEVELTGYFRAGGSVSVLGIITISVEFYLGFTYLSPGKAYGKASLKVSISIFFFSISVTLTVEKKIGGGGDPTFLDNVPTQAIWNTYCDAFA